MKIILIGLPGSGKGTQAAILSKKYNIPHISTGEMLRDIAKTDTHLGRDVAAILAKGQLVPDELSISVSKKRISEPDCKNGYILDGFPRSLVQAESIEESDYVFVFDIPHEEVTQRLLKRGRADDKEDVIRNRLARYEEDIEEIIIHFHLNGHKVCIVNAAETVDEVTSLIEFYME